MTDTKPIPDGKEKELSLGIQDLYATIKLKYPEKYLEIIARIETQPKSYGTEQYNKGEINCMFSWSPSPEGYGYWCDIWTKIKGIKGNRTRKLCAN